MPHRGDFSFLDARLPAQCNESLAMVHAGQASGVPSTSAAASVSEASSAPEATQETAETPAEGAHYPRHCLCQCAAQTQLAAPPPCLMHLCIRLCLAQGQGCCTKHLCIWSSHHAVYFVFLWMLRNLSSIILSLCCICYTLATQAFLETFFVHSGVTRLTPASHEQHWAQHHAATALQEHSPLPLPKRPGCPMSQHLSMRSHNPMY